MAREEKVLQHGVHIITMFVYSTLGMVCMGICSALRNTIGWPGSFIGTFVTCGIIAGANVLMQVLDEVYVCNNRDKREQRELRDYIQKLKDQIGENYTEPKWELSRWFDHTTSFAMNGDKKIQVQVHTHRKDKNFSFTTTDGKITAVNVSGAHENPTKFAGTYSVCVGKYATAGEVSVDEVCKPSE